MRIMVARRQENMQVLAAELGVTDRTIRNDILVLTAEYPLETSRGNGGGVRIADWWIRFSVNSALTDMFLLSRTSRMTIRRSGVY